MIVIIIYIIIKLYYCIVYLVLLILYWSVLNIIIIINWMTSKNYDYYETFITLFGVIAVIIFLDFCNLL